MKNKIILFIILLIVPLISVSATSYNTGVSSDVSYDTCVNFQDKYLSTNSYGYFGHCIQATCPSGTWKTDYLLTNNMVRCNNGNTDKYYQTVKSGCNIYYGSCTPTSATKYCTVVAFYDCTKTSNGQPYIAPTTTTTTTTTTTKKPVVYPPTTKTPLTSSSSSSSSESSKKNNNYLKSLTLSVGKIDFIKTNTTYTISIPSSTKSINVTAIAEDDKAAIKIENNTNINFKTPIKVIVTAENGEIRTYTINLISTTTSSATTKKKNVIVSNIEVKNHTLKFDPDLYTYSVTLSKNETTLNISVELKDKTSQYVITGNNNLKNKSIIEIKETDADDNSVTYLINIKKSSNVGIVIVIILIVLLIIYILFKLIKKVFSKKEES